MATISTATALPLNRAVLGLVSEIKDLVQELKYLNKWDDFLSNDMNKYSLVNLIVNYSKESILCCKKGSLLQ